MDVREASECARNRNKWRAIVTVLIGICYNYGATVFLGNPVVAVVRELVI